MVESFNYADLMGGQISCEFPYLVMIAFGYAFSRTGMLKEEGVVSFSKIIIEIFLPVYLFIQIAKSTSTESLDMNFPLILSVLFYILFTGAICFTYAYFTKMDIRYRYTWIAITCFTDIKDVHRMMINSFCYHISGITTASEEAFCKDLPGNSFVHLFFQGIIIWYAAFNLMRIDKKYTKKLEKMTDFAGLDGDKQEAVELKVMTVATEENKNSARDTEEVRKVIDEYRRPGEEKNVNNYHATNSFYKKVKDLQLRKGDEIEKVITPRWKEMLYVLLRPPLIAMFTGFIVGFITPIKNWIFDTTTVIYLFYDTFNTIGNAHIICAFLILGANLYMENPSKVKFSKKDLGVHLLLKCLILPFCGVIFSTIANIYLYNNRVLNFACFIQWILPTSIDILAISQAKEINVRYVCICMAIQWAVFVCLNNFIELPAFLRTINLI